MSRLTSWFPVSTAAASAFVPCPLVGLVPPGQVAQVVEVYRLAAERVRDQLAAGRPDRLPAFSAN